MVTKLEFDMLFGRLTGNPWKYFPEKTRLRETKDLYYDKLKHYTAIQVSEAFEAYIDGKEFEYLPLVERIVANIERESERKAYTSITLPVPKINLTRSKRIKKLIRDTREVVNDFGNDKIKLRNICKSFCEKGKEEVKCEM